MLKGNQVFIGAPKSVRDFIYISDHLAAYSLALEKDLPKGEAYNVSSGTGITIEALAKRIAKMIGFNLEKIKLGCYPPGYPFRPFVSDQPYLVLNSDKINEKFDKVHGNLEKLLNNAINSSEIFDANQVQYFKNQKDRSKKAKDRFHKAGGFKQAGKKKNFKNWI